MVLALLLAASWTTMVIAPGTPIARLLDRLLVVGAVAALNRVRPSHIVLPIVISVLLIGGWWLGGDALNIAAWTSPEIIAALGSLEVSIYVDVVVAGAMTWSVARVGLPTSQWLVSAWRRGVRRQSRPVRPAHRRQVPANDDDREWELRAA